MAIPAWWCLATPGPAAISGDIQEDVLEHINLGHGALILPAIHCCP